MTGTKQKKLTVRDKKIKALLKNGRRQHVKKDFFELLKRATTNSFK